MSDLTKITINLDRRARQALERRTAEGSPRTDAINRAILVDDLVRRLSAEDGGHLAVRRPDGSVDRIHIL